MVRLSDPAAGYKTSAKQEGRCGRERTAGSEAFQEGGCHVTVSLTASAAPAASLDTMPKLLLRNAATNAARPALRHKDFGIWQTWTWAGLRDEVRALAVGLRKLGLDRGEAVAII